MNESEDGLIFRWPPSAGSTKTKSPRSFTLAPDRCIPYLSALATISAPSDREKRLRGIRKEKFVFPKSCSNKRRQLMRRKDTVLGVETNMEYCSSAASTPDQRNPFLCQGGWCSFFPGILQSSKIFRVSCLRHA
jgi:hypothetical protein